MTMVTEAQQGEIDRILGSQTLRSSEVLRHLLRYLADRSMANQSGELNEYTVGIEALQKPQDYDPRQDSTVRLQASRLRRKLAEYYDGEGKNSPVVVSLPKRGFRLVFVDRFPASVPVIVAQKKQAPYYELSMLILLSASLAWAIFATLQMHEARASSVQSPWTAELEGLWAPFLDSNRPLVEVVSAPLFIDVGDKFRLRDASINQFEAVSQSRAVDILIKGLAAPEVKPFYGYSYFGNLPVTLMLGQLVGGRKPISLVNSSQMTWEQLSTSNVMFVGNTKFLLASGQLPVGGPLVLESGVGVHDTDPAPGEQKDYLDQITKDGSRGVTYALVTHMPGLQKQGDIISFIGSTSPGIEAAAQCFTSASGAKLLDGLLREPSGAWTRYFQILLRVEFQEDTVPTNTSIVLVRKI